MTEEREVALVVASKVPLLLLRLGMSIVRLAVGSRRGAVSFRRALRRNGVEPALARKLTDHYRDQFNLMKLVQIAMRTGR